MDVRRPKKSCIAESQGRERGGKAEIERNQSSGQDFEEIVAAKSARRPERRYQNVINFSADSKKHLKILGYYFVFKI